VARALGLSLAKAALAVMDVVGERMVQVIEEVTIAQGVDPASAVLVAGGGAAGFRAIELGRRLGCRAVFFPAIGPALSAVGALVSDLLREVRCTRFGRLSALTAAQLADIHCDLQARLAEDEAPTGAAPQLEFFFEGRYERQIWEIEVPVGNAMPDGSTLGALRAAFDGVHAQRYGVADARSEVEIVSWGVRARSAQRGGRPFPRLCGGDEERYSAARTRRAVFAELGEIDVPVVLAGAVRVPVFGPLIVESDMSTLIVPPGCRIAPALHGLLASFEPAEAAP